MFHHQVDLVFYKDVCFIAPLVRCLPPLRWNPEDLKFVPLKDEGETQELLSYVDSHQKMHRQKESSALQVRWSRLGVFRCQAIYGVLQLGSDTCALIFVAACDKMGDFTISSEHHEVYRARQMKWLRLPRMEPDGAEDPKCPSSSRFGSEPPMSEEFTYGTRHRNNVNREYFSVLNVFCRSVESDSSLYFCSTLNMSYNPQDIISVCSVTADDESMDAPQRARNKAFSIQSFQWNHMLLRHFSVPDKNEICMGECGGAPLCPRSSRSFVRQWAGGEQINAVSLDALLPRFNASAMLYVPAFIRGFFGCATNGQITTYVVTRLSCQWAGTRFNRRGLEPGNTGVCANMAISSVWCVGCSNNSQGGEASTTSCAFQVAVFDLIRGSIPRHWEQPANLAIKPPIHLPSDTRAGEEFFFHVRLLSRLLPGLANLMCVDCTSHGRGEGPLSHAYRDAVTEYNAKRSADEEMQRNLPDVHYLKSCVGSLVLKKWKPFKEVTNYLLQQVKEVLVTDHHNPDAWVDFTTWSEGGASPTPIVKEKALKTQTYFYRINCVDCIDRTTIAQCCLVSAIFPKMLEFATGGCSAAEEEEHVKNLLALVRDQGYVISVLYSGTSHHLSSYPTRGLVRPQDVVKLFFVMILRWYQQNFFDGKKQDAVSLVTLQHNAVEMCYSVDGSLAHDFRNINRDFFYGSVCAMLPLIYSLLAVVLADGDSRKFHIFFLGLWTLFCLLIYFLTRQMRETFTSRPLLCYGK